MKKITLMVAFICSISFLPATTYLVQSGTSGAATWRAAQTDEVLVNLQTIGAGGTPVTLNEWLNDKNLEVPTYSGNTFVSGNEIWLAKGTYTINGRDTLAAGVSMYGGFAGSELTLTERVKNSSLAWDYKNASIIDGANLHIGLITASSTERCIIGGITFQNCINASKNSSGAGAKLQGANTIMQNCIVAYCTASGALTTGASAGVSVVNKATLKDSYIHHNTSTSTGTAGGVTLFGDLCVVTGCTIDKNKSLSAGGLYLYSNTSGAVVSNCIISNHY